jgi:hypothetical protein
MDLKKCKALKSRLGPDRYGQVVPIADFFDGNDDLGSIGCNVGEVGDSEQFGVSPSIGERHGSPVLVVWWD